MKSYRAEAIDNEYRRKRDFLFNTFIKENCHKCKNKDTDLCRIVIKRDGNAGCVYYKEEGK